MSLYDRVVERVARTRAGAWVAMRLATPIDRYVMRWTRGRVSSGLGSRFQGMVALVVMRGARSGLERTVPLLATRYGDRLIVIASHGGSQRNPAWYGNLKKTPRCRVLFGGAWGEYEAREAEGDERARLWDLAVRNYPGYSDYQARVERRIPVMVLDPRPP
jgi:deazaflavin-dependent oxidoreductase (nitroreductase family)